jgi:diaminopimelate decarboxylase
MTPFQYINQQLHCESVPLARLAAEHGTPLYVYSANRIRQNYQRIAKAFAPLNPTICYAVKANSNLSILKLLQDEGAGFDIVSGGELFRALQVGADPARIVFAGVGKTEQEIDYALRSHVGWINVESFGELKRLSAVAGRLGMEATAAIRLRPDVEADTHHHISTGSAASKFGVPVNQALEMVTAKLPHLRIRGAHIHIGSQLGSPDATLQALEVLLDFVNAANSVGVGGQIDTLDIGGGFPVAYRDDDAPQDIESFAAPILSRLKSWKGSVHVEPGRSVVADSAVLLTSVQYEKMDSTDHRIVIVDAGMQTLIRPALYEAYHRVWPVRADLGVNPYADVAGPICESSDFLARDRNLPNLASGDLLAVLDAGAYGFAMASNYNSHPLPAEVLVDGDSHRLIRGRQTIADLVANESDLLPSAALH